MSGPPSPRRQRGVVPTAAVLAVLTATVFGGYVAAGVLSVPAGPAVEVGGGVRVSPLSGWAVVGRLDREGVPTVRLTRGSANLDVLVASFVGSARDLADLYVERFLTPGATQLSVSKRLQTIRLPSGVHGVRFAYVGVFHRTGAATEGEVTAAISPSGGGVVFDGWAPEGLLSFALDDIHATIERAAV